MRNKALELVVEVELQAVTCPGVWLCPNGKCSVHIYMLGYCGHTAPQNPIFPLLYHENFIFRRAFCDARKLNDLERRINKEIVYIELIQWENCDEGCVLATFKTSLVEFLYPFLEHNADRIGVDVDLLMEATKRFPGIIAPKIEISTKTTIEEIVCTTEYPKKYSSPVNKMLVSKCVPRRKAPVRQRRVCHTYEYHRNKMGKIFENVQYMRPYEKPIQNLSLPNCSCNINREEEKNNEDTNYISEKLRSIRLGLSPRTITDERNFSPSPYKSATINSPCKSATINTNRSTNRGTHRGDTNNFDAKITETKMICTCKNKRVSCPLCTKYTCYFSKCNCSKEKHLVDNRSVTARKSPGDFYKKAFSINMNDTESKSKFRQSVNDASMCRCAFARNSSICLSSKAGEMHRRLQYTLDSRKIPDYNLQKQAAAKLEFENHNKIRLENVKQLCELLHQKAVHNLEKENY